MPRRRTDVDTTLLKIVGLRESLHVYLDFRTFKNVNIRALSSNLGKMSLAKLGKMIDLTSKLGKNIGDRI